MGKRVLVVDDEAGHGRLMEKILVAAGHEVVLAASYDEGRRSALTDAFDALVADLQLDGDRNGVDLAVQAKRHYGGLEVIIVSASPPAKVDDIFRMEGVRKDFAKRILYRGAANFAKDLRRSIECG